MSLYFRRYIDSINVSNVRKLKLTLPLSKLPKMSPQLTRLKIGYGDSLSNVMNKGGFSIPLTVEKLSITTRGDNLNSWYPHIPSTIRIVDFEKEMLGYYDSPINLDYFRRANIYVRVRSKK